MFPVLIEQQLALYRISCLYSKAMMEATEFYDATAEEASLQFGNVAVDPYQKIKPGRCHLFHALLVFNYFEQR